MIRLATRHTSRASRELDRSGDMIEDMTLSNLSSGLLGSVVGGLLTFAAAAFTLWRTRVGDRRRESRRLEDMDRERREALAVELIYSLRNLESEVRWAPLLSGRTQRHVLEVSLKLYLAERQQNPNVANWLLAQTEPLNNAFARWRRACLVPRVGRQRLREVGELTGQLVALMTQWAGGDVPDSAFKDATLSPLEIANAVGAANTATLNHGKRGSDVVDGVLRPTSPEDE